MNGEPEPAALLPHTGNDTLCRSVHNVLVLTHTHMHTLTHNHTPIYTHSHKNEHLHTQTHAPLAATLGGNLRVYVQELLWSCVRFCCWAAELPGLAFSRPKNKFGRFFKFGWPLDF